MIALEQALWFSSAGLSRNEERIVEVLWQTHQRDPSVRLHHNVLAKMANVASLGEINRMRVKLRRIGWDLEGKMGRNGGYRLVPFAEFVVSLSTKGS